MASRTSAKAAARRQPEPARPKPLPVEEKRSTSAIESGNLDEFYQDWQRYFDLYNFAPVPYIRLDRSGVVEEINQAGCQMLAALQGVILRRPLIVFMTSESRVDFLEHMRRSRTRDIVVETELSLQARDGRVVPVRAFTKRSNGMAKTAYWTVLIDLTEHRRLDAAWESAVQERVRAEDETRLGRIANEATHRFLNMLSHELRTPLTPALFAASRLLEHDMPEPARRLGELIKRNIQSEARLIDDLLDVSRIERGCLDLSLSAVDIHATVGEALDMSRPLVGKKAIELKATLYAPRHHVNGDAGRLRQVVSNLLSNAIKFTDGGTIEIGTSDDDMGNIHISVRDSGIGLDAHALSNLFKSFQRPRGESSRGGLGLGLAICRGVIDAHRGRIWASSEGIGLGSKFEIELRTIEPPSVFAARHDTMRTRSESSERSAPMRILIVEDDGDTAAILQELLAQDGHSMDVVHTLRDAQRQAREPWDVVISDLGLPDGSGFDVARQFEGVNPRPRLIALSGYGSESDVTASTAAGFERHLVKPIDLNRLRQALRA